PPEEAAEEDPVAEPIVGLRIVDEDPAGDASPRRGAAVRAVGDRGGRSGSGEDEQEKSRTGHVRLTVSGWTRPGGKVTTPPRYVSDMALSLDRPGRAVVRAAPTLRFTPLGRSEPTLRRL